MPVQTNYSGNGDVPYKLLSTPEWLAVAALAAPFFIVFDSYHEEKRAFVAALSAGSVMGVAWLLRPLMKKPAFWALNGLSVALHAVIVFLTPPTGGVHFGFLAFSSSCLTCFCGSN
jgi:hypothetical protein